MRQLKAVIVGVAASVLCTLVLLSTAYARADEPPPQAFDIGPQSLAAALTEFARESKQEILFAPDVVANKLSSGVRGTMPPPAALKILLKESGLGFSSTPNGAILVGSPRSASPLSQSQGNAADQVSEKDGQKEGKKSSSDGFRVAQVDQGATQNTASVAGTVSGIGQSTVKLEEIVVTAQKRAERLQDVPISIVAITEAELRKRHITSLDDLSTVVPGLAIQSSGGFQRRIELRGISNISGSASTSLVGMYLDEADVTAGAFSQLDLQTYDLERVEVLRGPQGTLYGDGAAGGTIRFITRNPELSHFAMDADVAALFTEEGAPSQRVQEALNLPVIADQVGLRIAGTFDHEGGWIDQPTANRKDFNDQNLADIRVKGLWQPSSGFTANAMALIHRNNGPYNAGEDAHGNFTQVFGLTTTPSAQDNYEVYNLTLTYDFANVRILNTTSYLNQDKETRNIGATLQVIPPGPIGPVSVYQPDQQIHTKTLNEELRLSSADAGPWRWTVGGFYRHLQFDFDLPAVYAGLSGPVGSPLPTPFPVAYSNRSNASAAFGDTSYTVAERLTLGAGLRYFRDNQEFTQGNTQAGSFHAVSPRAYADYKLTPQANLYASAAKGFRSGGFNTGVNVPVFDPEDVWTYEVGSKMSLLAGRLSSEVALFLSNYTNFQVSSIEQAPPFLNIVSNAGEARIKGIEWAFNWTPIDQWVLSFNGNYVDAKFVAIKASAASSPVYTYNVGDPVDFVPKYAFTVSAQRNFKWNEKEGFLRLDYNQQGRETLRDRTIGPWYFGESDVIRMLNFNSSLQCTESLSLGLFARNLLNNRGYTDPFTTLQTISSRSRPRSYGISFAVKFH